MWDRRVVRLGEAIGQGGDHLPVIERMGDGLADALVLEQRVIGLEQQAADRHDRAHRHLDARHRLEFLGVAGGDVRQQVDVVRHQRRLGRRGIGNDHEAHGVDQRLFLAGKAIGPGIVTGAVILEACQLHRLARFPLRQGERAGADRRLPAAVRGDRIRMQDAAGAAIRPSHGGEEQAARLVELEHHGQRVRRGDAGDFRPATTIEFSQAAPLRLRVKVMRPGPFDVGGAHRRAVMKAHPVAQLESVSQAVVGHLHGLGQQRADGGVFAMGHEPLDDVQHDRIGVFVTVDPGLGAADVGIEAHAQGGIGLGQGAAERHHAECLQGHAKGSVQ
ncbi:hypothetical protein D3C73_724230 [compost metagenome]